MKTYLGLVGTLTATILLTACGGSSSSSNDAASEPDTQVPEVVAPEVTEPEITEPEVIEPVVSEPCGDQVQLLFPASYSATLSNSITVRGTATCDSIESLSINGIAATSSDDFSNWQATISLQSGRNTISAVVTEVMTEADETHNLDLAVIESNELLNSPDQMVMTADNSILYAIDTSRRHVIKLDMASGARTIVSSTDYPSQDLYFGNMGGIALNEAEGLLYIGSRFVEDNGVPDKAWILSVNINTGVRSIISDAESGVYTPLMSSVSDLEYDSANKKLYATNNGKIYQIELDENETVGEQILISSDTVPDANNPIPSNSNLSIVLDVAGERLLVLDQGGSGNSPQLLAVNLASAQLGERTVISNDSNYSASWDSPTALTMTDNDMAYALDRRSSQESDVDIIQINLTSGDRDVYSNGSFGAAKGFVGEVEMIFDNSSQQLIVSNQNSKAFFTLSLSDFERKTLAYNLDPEIVGNENLGDLKRSALDSENNKLYYQVENAEIKVLDITTLEHSDFATVSGDGYTGSAIDSMNFDPILNSIVVTGEFDSNNAHVRSYAIVDGSETIISDDTTGTGDDLNEIWDWVRLNETTAIIADDTSSPTQYYELDIATGNRVLINVDYSGMPSNLEAEDIALSADKNTLYVVDDSPNVGLYALDLTSKTFTTITNDTLPIDGNALRLGDPESLALSSDGLYAYVGDNNAAYLIKVNLATGAREGFIGDVVRNTNSWSERINGISVDNNSQLIYTTDTSTDVILMMDEVTNEWVMIAE